MDNGLLASVPIGHAAVLMTRLAQQLQVQALTPILHVFADNASAIALYEKLGFTKRRTLHITVLRAAQAKPAGVHSAPSPASRA